jgi:hypothetical protein
LVSNWGCGVTKKTLMPKYREFDDERYFVSLLKEAQEHNMSYKEYLEPYDIIID